jgi:hypothetical protein
MMEPTRYIQSNNAAADGFDQNVNDPRAKSSRYAQPRVAEKSGYPLEENLPIFLAGSEEEKYTAQLQDNWAYDNHAQESWPPEAALQQDALQQSALQQSAWQHSGYEQDPWEQETWETQRRKGLTALRVMKFALVAAAVVGSVFAAFTLQGKHALIADASASLAAVLPALPGIKSPPPAPRPVNQPAAESVQVPPNNLVQPNSVQPGQVQPSPASAPSRQAIASAFQTALQVQPAIQSPPPVVQQPAIVPPPEPAARSIDPDELTALLKRAKSMMDIGDIASARLLLERAAGAHEAKAALLLAQTYDPAVLGATDLRTITADPATARLWYQKAAEFGSEEARSRLAQMSN